MDVLVLETHQQIVAAIEVQHMMKEIVVFARSVSQECEQRAVEELVDVLVEVIKGIQQERLSKRTAEQMFVRQHRKSRRRPLNL